MRARRLRARAALGAFFRVAQRGTFGPFECPSSAFGAALDGGLVGDRARQVLVVGARRAVAPLAFDATVRAAPASATLAALLHFLRLRHGNLFTPREAGSVPKMRDRMPRNATREPDARPVRRRR